MSDEEKPLSHQDVEKWCKEMPDSIATRLPDNIAGREVRRLIPIINDLAHESLEKPAQPRG